MTDPIGPIASLAAPRTAEPRTAEAPARTAAPEPAGTPPPLSVDVERSDSGVFVYTLRDPATDTVLAVIPRAVVLVQGEGRHVDERA